MTTEHTEWAAKLSDEALASSISQFTKVLETPANESFRQMAIDCITAIAEEQKKRQR